MSDELLSVVPVCLKEKNPNKTDHFIMMTIMTLC